MFESFSDELLDHLDQLEAGVSGSPFSERKLNVSTLKSASPAIQVCFWQCNGYFLLTSIFKREVIDLIASKQLTNQDQVHKCAAVKSLQHRVEGLMSKQDLAPNDLAIKQVCNTLILY